MIIYEVKKYVRDGSMGTTNEDSYYTLKAFLNKESAEKYLNDIVNEFNEEHVDGGKEYCKEEGEELSYMRITYSGSPIEDDVDYKQLYIEELEVEES